MAETKDNNQDIVQRLRGRLQALVPLNALTQDNFEALLQDIQVLKVPAGKTIFKVGSTDNRNVYLLAGDIVLQDAAGKSVMVRGGSDQARHPIGNQRPRRYSAIVKTDAVIAHMDRVGVQHSIICPSALFNDPVAGNLEGEAMCSRHKDRFSGYLVYNPFYEDTLKPKLDEFFSRGFFVGFKLLSDYWQVPVTDPRYDTVWEYANKNSMPILLHTWTGAFNSPAMLTDIVLKYPNATFILGHSGGPSRHEAEELALAHPNVMLEFCGSFTSSVPWEETIKKVGNDRVLFGSDTCAHDLAWEMGRFLSIPLPDSELIPILGENMKKILKKGKRV